MESLVKKYVTAIREARKASERLEFYSDMAAAAQKHNLTHAEMAAYGASILIVGLIEMTKTDGGGIVDATAAALQTVSDMTQDPASVIRLWTQE